MLIVRQSLKYPRLGSLLLNSFDQPLQIDDRNLYCAQSNCWVDSLADDVEEIWRGLDDLESSEDYSDCGVGIKVLAQLDLERKRYSFVDTWTTVYWDWIKNY